MGNFSFWYFLAKKGKSCYLKNILVDPFDCRT
jgi:hypothetical protein